MNAAHHLTQARRMLLASPPQFITAERHMNRAIHYSMLEGTRHWLDAHFARRKLPRGGVR